MSVQSKEVADYYDDFSEKQVSLGLNIRHRVILSKLRHYGLKRNHKVLEIGCGVGLMTRALGKFLKSGHVTALDISPESIRLASKLCEGMKNVAFMASEAHTPNFSGKYDFVVLPDVLEHIPVEQHPLIFQNLREHLHEKSLVFIHIPSPGYIGYLKDYSPEKLQVIDQAIEAGTLVSIAEAAGLRLKYFYRYGLHIREGDYNILLFDQGFDLGKVTQVNGIQLIFKELISRLDYLLFRTGI